MSLIKANAVQIGQSGTATQNFTLAVPSSPDGTIKLARGNSGATTQDVINVDASGNVSLNKDTTINGLTVGKGAGNQSGNTACGSNALAANTTGNNNTAVGLNSLRLNQTGINNTAVGLQALENNLGNYNTAVGVQALDTNTTGGSNTGIGVNALLTNTTGGNNTSIGSNSLRLNTTGINNVAVGVQALDSNTTGNFNTAVGTEALDSNTTGNNNTASGHSALFSNTTGTNNTACGYAALQDNTYGQDNTAVGCLALDANTTGINNTACGKNTLGSNTTGSNNVACGNSALVYNTSGDNNTAIGVSTLGFNTTGINNTASGFQALFSNTIFSNIGGFGYNAQVTASNQIQLGDAATTTYAYGAVQNRSDIRDKADIRDTTLGLEFVNALRPVDFKWDLREDYRPEAPKSVDKPAELKEDASDEEKAKYEEELAAYNAYKVELDKWLEDVKLANITHDGSKKRSRFHHGLIAQEVKAVLDAKGIDFGGFQDHSVKGGDDVLSIGYEELISPLIKAIQELSAKVEALESK